MNAEEQLAIAVEALRDIVDFPGARDENGAALREIAESTLELLGEASE